MSLSPTNRDLSKNLAASIPVNKDSNSSWAIKLVSCFSRLIDEAISSKSAPLIISSSAIPISSFISEADSESIISSLSSEIISDLDLTSGFKISVSLIRWKVSPKSIGVDTSFKLSFAITLSNSSGNASPDEYPRSPNSSIDASSSLNSFTAVSKSVLLLLTSLKILLIKSFASPSEA